MCEMHFYDTVHVLRNNVLLPLTTDRRYCLTASERQRGCTDAKSCPGIFTRVMFIVIHPSAGVLTLFLAYQGFKSQISNLIVST